MKTVSQLSEKEINWVDDIRKETEQAIAFLGDLDAEDFESDDLLIAAVERKVMNITEACLRIERGRKEEGRFKELFPAQDIDVIRGMGNHLRHGYDDIHAPVIYDTVKYDLPDIHKRACELLGR